jgi:hypothetical protein
VTKLIFFVKILKTKQVERKKWWVATRAVFNIYFRLLTYTLAGFDLTTQVEMIAVGHATDAIMIPTFLGCLSWARPWRSTAKNWTRCLSHQKVSYIVRTGTFYLIVTSNQYVW